MVTFIILIGIVAFIIYRFQQDLTKGYASIQRKVAPLKSRILLVAQAYRDVLDKYFSIYRQRGSLQAK